MIEYNLDENATQTMNKAFHVKFSDARKEWLEKYDPTVSKFCLDDEKEIVHMSISEYLNNELIKFSHNDCKRSIPSLIDGLKESQRKILYAVKKRNLTYNKQSLKVAQLGGYVAEHTNYHHGEQNLYETIIKMANEFPGSNNIPLLYRDGQFGSRINGGKDAASARYIFTKMEPLTPLLFREEDDVLLERVVDDGDIVEPKFYIPILPMILINGCTAGIGTGWSCNVPNYNPLDVINAVKEWLDYDGEVLIKDPDDGTTLSMLTELKPWYRGYEGIIEKQKEKFVSYGNIIKDKNKVEVTELPIGMWTDKFKEFCEDLLVEKQIKSMKNNSSTKKVKFTITETDDGIICNTDTLKLYSYLHITNMVLFDEKERLKKYSIDQIINDFCILRYEYYIKRKNYILKVLDKDLKHSENKARFIQEIIDKKLNIMNIDEEVVVKELEKRGYDKEYKNEDNENIENTNNHGYNYLLKLQVRTFTTNKVKELKDDIVKIKDKINNIKNTSEKQMWMNDLDEFTKEYIKWLDIMNKLDQNDGKGKKVTKPRKKIIE
jgi:DNA topoisomerase-2